MFKETFWAPVGSSNEDVVLLHHANYSESGCGQSVLDLANREGYWGSLKDRLNDLGWEIKEFKFEEVNS